MHDIYNYEYDYSWTWRNEVKKYLCIGGCIAISILAGVGLGTLAFILLF